MEESFSLHEVLGFNDKLLKLEEGNKQRLIALTKENIRTGTEPVATDSAQLQEDIAAQNDQLLRNKTNNFTKELAAQRLQLAEVLNYLLTKEDTSKLSFDTKETLDLAKDVMKLKDLTKDIQESEEKLMEAFECVLKLEKEASELTKQRQQLWKELNSREDDMTHPESQVEERLKDLQKRAQDECKTADLGASILRKMIVGSKLNWAKDPELLEIMLPREHHLE